MILLNMFSVPLSTRDAAVESLMRPYKQHVDSVMNPVVGRAAIDMVARKPESSLSNLLSDILIWGGKAYGEAPDFSVYNMGGIRAALTKGDVTVGDVVDVAPFENKICFLTLNGEQVLQLFEQIASVGGDGVSRGVRLVCGADGSLKQATLNGKAIDKAANYRIATLDYLAQGNDKLEAFKLKREVNSPQDEKSNIRYIIINYLKQQAAEGKAVEAKVEGRITIE